MFIKKWIDKLTTDPYIGPISSSKRLPRKGN
jgi:hypothetical protein